MKTSTSLAIFLIVVTAPRSTRAADTSIGNCSSHLSAHGSTDLTIRCDHNFDEPTNATWIERCLNGTALLQDDAVRAINFSNCHISRLPFGIFKAYPYLRTLDISSVGLDLLQFPEFVAVDGLNELNASHNRVPYIETSELTVKNRRCTLTKLDFSYNEISVVGSEAFHVYCPRLEWVDLSHNVIDTIYSRTFSKLHGLRFLNVSHNKLNSVSIDVFAVPIALRLLDVSFNHITSFDLEFLPQVGRIGSFIVEGNPLVASAGFFEQLNDQTRVERGNWSADTVPGLFIWLGVLGVTIILLTIALVTVLLTKSTAANPSADQMMRSERVEAVELNNSLYCADSTSYAYVAHSEHDYETLDFHPAK